MKIIFAQGNPEARYQTTRHNIGFQVVDTLARDENTSFATKQKFFAEVAEYSVGSDKVLLVKPTTYYNETGRSLRAILDFYKLTPQDVLVVHDELALPFGTLRSRIGGSDAGNNGIKSINANGGTDTARLRIGVGNELRAKMGDVDFVLANFSKAEAATLTATIIPKSLEMIRSFIANDHQITSHTIEI